MWDILSFNTFVTQDVLIFFYYIGAVGIPIVVYSYKDYFIKLISKHTFFSSNEKKVFWFVSISLFLCMELCWRMVFEAMIGYFDMHDYLHVIAQKM